MARPLADPAGQHEPRPSWFKRIGWLALIWAASVAVLSVVAALFRLLMGWAGLTT